MRRMRLKKRKISLSGKIFFTKIRDRIKQTKRRLKGIVYTLHSIWNEQKKNVEKTKVSGIKGRPLSSIYFVYEGARQTKFRRVIIPSDYVKVQMKPLIICNFQFAVGISNIYWILNIYLNVGIFQIISVYAKYIEQVKLSMQYTLTY